MWRIAAIIAFSLDLPALRESSKRVGIQACVCEFARREDTAQRAKQWSTSRSGPTEGACTRLFSVACRSISLLELVVSLTSFNFVQQWHTTPSPFNRPVRWHYILLHLRCVFICCSKTFSHLARAAFFVERRPAKLKCGAGGSNQNAKGNTRELDQAFLFWIIRARNRTKIGANQDNAPNRYLFETNTWCQRGGVVENRQDRGDKEGIGVQTITA